MFDQSKKPEQKISCKCTFKLRSSDCGKGSVLKLSGSDHGKGLVFKLLSSEDGEGSVQEIERVQVLNTSEQMPARVSSQALQL